MRIDREFNDPKVIEALEHVDEATLMEILDDAEVLDALKQAKRRNDPMRPAAEFLAELESEKLI